MTSAATTTPMMRQYYDLKRAHPGTLMLFRCGDFYETYAEDAEEAGRVLNIIVTRKSAGAEGMVAMAGVPFHAIDNYLAKLVRAGKRVAIAEQMEDPATAKGIVRREVVRVVTPGTAIEDGIVEDRANNYLVCLTSSGAGVWGIALADLSTAFFAITEVSGATAEEDLVNELTKLDPREILLPEKMDSTILRSVFANGSIPITRLPESHFRHESATRLLTEHFRVQSLDGFGATELTTAVCSAGALLQYLKDTQKSSVSHIRQFHVRWSRDTMMLDAITQRSLELVKNIHSGGKEATLLSVLDRTQTPMGARMLRGWLLEPLREKAAIESRLNCVDDLHGSLSLRAPLADTLRGMRDLERIVSRAALGTAGPRDLAVLRLALEKLPRLKVILSSSAAARLKELGRAIDPLADLTDLLRRGLVEEPPAVVRDGGVVRPGYNKELDEIVSLARGGKDFIAQLRQEEADRTGIPGLKIGYNRVFGYYIELTHVQMKQLPNGAPPEYIRKQTIANGERFITPALKEKEEMILNAEERIIALESSLFSELREQVAEASAAILHNAQAVGEIDCYLSLADVALSQGYRRPQMNDEGRFEIAEGRHPVLEAIQREPAFVPNDTLLDPQQCQIALITGPNMAGKSTYIRQVALIVLMAQIGSFVPARHADIAIRDRIFTRVGAMDHLARGQSTFLVEMTEMSNILRHATNNSLVILDEVGRGTSTYDGLSIAWSVCEFLHNTKGRRPLTLFATHYHELTALEQALPRLKNFSVAIQDEKSRIIFLYRIVRGHTDHSYGIHAAELAGVPAVAVARAREILHGLESGEPVAPRVSMDGEAPQESPHKAARTRKAASILPIAEPWDSQQLSLFETSQTNKAVERLKQIDPHRLTPMEALALLAELKRDAEG
ncbi:MAG: DNA mismatch repair protein MutS [Candidatus Sumerlaeota bacterium]